MRAASQRTDPNDARITQRYEEEERANKFFSGLLPEIHCQLSSKRHINLREAINPLTAKNYNFFTYVQASFS